MIAVAMVSVSSSNVAEVGYDASEDELHVRFKGGPAVYVYPGVSYGTYLGLLAAESVGTYFHRNVKTVVPRELVRKEAVDATEESSVG